MHINGVHFPKDQIAEFCRRHGVAKLSLFGSILRDDFSPDSDVDVLVDFQPSTRIGLIGMANLESELEGIIGRRVDLRTAADLSRYFRDDVVHQARQLHAA